MKKNNSSFHFKNLHISLHPEVYGPAEDSFFLLDSIDIDAEHTVLEIGTGCGLIALACAAEGASVLCTDINPYAITLVQKNIKENQHLLIGSVQIIQSDMFSAVKQDQRFDRIIFNPPYLPECSQSPLPNSYWLDAATLGGKDGLTQTKRFIQGIKSHLLDTGFAITLISSQSSSVSLQNLLRNTDLSHKKIKTYRFHDERLFIYRFQKK